ncbi:hypothetical protein R6Q59_000454 [Mikania micrantha]
MEYLRFKIALLLIIFLFVPAWSYAPNSPSPSPSNPDYCTSFCGTEDALCDTNNGNCICYPGILKLPQPNVPFKRRSLLWHCQNDDICKNYWCDNQDSYCDDGACICHPCGPKCP